MLLRTCGNKLVSGDGFGSRKNLRLTQTSMPLTLLRKTLKFCAKTKLSTVTKLIMTSDKFGCTKNPKYHFPNSSIQSTTGNNFS